MEPSEIGRFGTLRLMKRLEPDTSIASFPIDDETVTFGRDPTCSVRLYYSSVSPLHAKIIFQDRKAFIVVLGLDGVHVDGCPVLPSSNPALPTTVPISNNSEIEIHTKRFIFTYPPKEMRAALDMSPQKDIPMTPGTRRKMLRMSMIQSAEVFTPRPSKDPMENLRILQSPFKRRAPSPLKQQYNTQPTAPTGEDDEVEEEIVLVDGNCPHVVEEEKDLVILESVEVEVPPLHPSPPTPLRLGAFGRPANSQGSSANPYQTPRRKLGRLSLHRAVLIRSAQRAVLKHDIEREEEEQEEKEVEEFIAEEVEGLIEEDEEYQQHDGTTSEDQGENGHVPQTIDQPSGWRTSLGLVKGFSWPFRSSSAAPEEKEEDEEVGLEGDYDEAQMNVDQELPPSSDSVPESALDSDPTTPVAKDETILPAPRSWGSFLTPQAGHAPTSIGVGRGAGQNSFSGVVAPSPGLGGPRRVRIEPKWKVTDIIVPLPNEEEIKQEEQASSIPVVSCRMQITEEERQAIRERRRSALTTPDPYFGGQVPGLGARRLSNAPGASPAPLPSLLATGTRSISPVKSQPFSPTKLAVHAGEQSGSEEEEDTRSLLDKMKQTVEVMKRRRSVGSLWGGDDEGKLDQEVGHLEQSSAVNNQEEDMDESDKENDGAGDDVEMANTQQTAQDAGEAEPDTVYEEKVVANEKDEDAPADLPLPSLTRKSTNPQTPQLESLKHLFSQPKPNTIAATPAVQSMRHLFKNAPPTDTETPRMDDMRNMFLREERSGQVIATPTFEGVGEMMRTPLAYRAGTPDADAAQPAAKNDPPTTQKTSVAVASTATRRRTPRANVSTSKPPPTEPPPELEVLAEEGTAAGTSTRTQPPAAAQKNASGPAPRKARLLRGRKPTPANDEPEATRARAPSRPNTEPKVGATRKIKAEPESEPVVPKRPPSRARATPIPEVTVETRSLRSEPSKARSRASAKSTPSTGETGTSDAPAKSTRAARKGVTTSAPRDASGRTTPSQPVRTADEDDHDPLDSIGETEDVPALKRKTRTAAVPRVKQEESDSAAAGVAAGPAGRKRAATLATSKPPVSAPTTRGKASAATRKKAPPVVTTKALPETSSESGMDKENTPSREDDDTSGQDAAGSAPKTTRGKRSATVSKPREVEKDDSAKPRTTRATRSRT
ncbi:hypothetical protein V8B97DRAFT_1873520 [Scleroderma yunnanense]